LKRPVKDVAEPNTALAEPLLESPLARACKAEVEKEIFLGGFSLDGPTARVTREHDKGMASIHSRPPLHPRTRSLSQEKVTSRNAAVQAAGPCASPREPLLESPLAQACKAEVDKEALLEGFSLDGPEPPSEPLLESPLAQACKAEVEQEMLVEGFSLDGPEPPSEPLLESPLAQACKAEVELELLVGGFSLDGGGGTAGDRPPDGGVAVAVMHNQCTCFIHLPTHSSSRVALTMLRKDVSNKFALPEGKQPIGFVDGSTQEYIGFSVALHDPSIFRAKSTYSILLMS